MMRLLASPCCWRCSSAAPSRKRLRRSRAMRRARWSACGSSPIPIATAAVRLTFRLDAAPPGRALALEQRLRARFSRIFARPPPGSSGATTALKLVDNKGTSCSRSPRSRPACTRRRRATRTTSCKRSPPSTRRSRRFFRESSRAAPPLICQMTLGNTAYDTEVSRSPHRDPLIAALSRGRAARPRPVRDARRQRPVMALRGKRRHLEPAPAPAPADGMGRP